MYIDDIVVRDITYSNIVDAGTDQTINQGDSVTIIATPSADTPTYIWTVNPADPSLLGQEIIQSPTVSPTQTTTYSVTADFGGGCTATDQVTIFVNGGCTLLLDDTYIQIQSADCGQINGSIEGITVTGNSGTETYSWIDASGVQVGTDINLIGRGSGSYSLSVEIGACITTIGPFSIDELDNCENPITSSIQIATVMTPNGDGSNDMFMIRGLENYPNNRLYIFNRWGNKVYEASSYNNDWFGNYQGRPLPIATYYYVLELNDLDRQVFKGAITIIR
nr:gliding motility-associated C-terminal domain-containing protein [Aquimarina sp. U1-2]